MPELPEVEAIRRRLGREAAGARIVKARFERPNVVAPQDPDDVERTLAGATIESVERRGKNLFLHLSGQQALHVHLRMTGNLFVAADFRFRPAAARAWFELEDGRALIFGDPRNLGTDAPLQ